LVIPKATSIGYQQFKTLLSLRLGFRGQGLCKELS
jgi:hypothetical protein